MYLIVFAIEVLARDPHRNRTSSCVVTTGQRSRWMRRLTTGLRSSSTTELRCSFSIIAVIGRALPPVHRGHGWTERQLVMSRCDGLIDRRATIEETGQLEHSRASSLPKLGERNSTSRVTLFSCGNSKRGRERDLKMSVNFYSPPSEDFVGTPFKDYYNSDVKSGEV